MKESVLKRFMEYVKIDTTVDPTSLSVPSSEVQWSLAHHLAAELKMLGVELVTVDEHGYVMGKLPSNMEQSVASIGLIAHMDTAPDCSGKNVSPQRIDHYHGEDILLKGSGDILSSKEFPELLMYQGETLITTDGTTLLGADDKAGIAEIMTMLSYLQDHPEIKHGTICIGFTPDEEIGRGADLFDVEKFGADFAYTVDGGAVGEVEYETFNAAIINLEIEGRMVHPGSAKNKLIHALSIAQELDKMIPAHERPEYTEGYEGFYLMTSLSGGVDKASVQYIIRDHDRDEFQARKDFMEACIAFLNRKYVERIRYTLSDQYYNMAEKIKDQPHVFQLAVSAIEKAGITPIIKPVRGGTDGSKLSFMGLPTPNIFSGCHNGHGKYEFISAEAMVKTVEVLLNIVALGAEVKK